MLATPGEAEASNDPVAGRGSDARQRFDPTAVDLRRATAVALDHGVWLRPFRNLIYVMPPFICTPAEVEQICAAMAAVARDM